MPAITYPLDTTGVSPGNLVTDEDHVLTEINSNTYRIIIPTFAPFYLDNFQLEYVDDLGNSSPLTEDVDYSFCLTYEGGKRSIGKILYGGITINTILLNGLLKVTYQTLGGSWTADADYVLERLAEMIYNPRITVWDVVTNVQEIFPPINHDQNMDYIFGYEELVAKLNEVAQAIALAQPSNQALINHITDVSNVHGVNKEQVGLGNVSNLPLATQNEVDAMLPVNKYVTLKQVIDLINLMRPL